MSTFVIKNRPFWLGAFEFSNVTQSVAIDYGADEIEATTLNDDTHVFKAGSLKTAGIAAEGFWDSAADNVIHGGIAGVRQVTVAAEEGNAGEIAYFTRGIVQENNIGGAIGDMMPFSMSMSVRLPLVRGTIAFNGSDTSDNNSAAYQLGALSSSQTLYSCVHCIASTGAGRTLDIDIESDSSGAFSTPTVRASHAQITSTGSEVITFAGAETDDYWRINYTIGGTTPNFTFVVSLGIL